MKLNTLIVFVFFFYFLFLDTGQLSGQGCSDAGACSIGSLGDSGKEEHRQSLKLSYDQNLGLGEKFTLISTTSVIVEHRFLKSTSFIVRVPFVFASGNLGNSSGVGDVVISFIQQLFQGENARLGLLAGGKIRTNHSDFELSGRPLPMAYQTSLGTNDVIAGIQFIYNTWDFYLAYQHPFGRNKNQYLHPEGETDEKKLYYESAQLKRGDDLAFRVQKTFLLKKDQSLQAGILPIFRLQKSEIIKNDVPVILDGSDGLTLNVFLVYSKKLKNNTLVSLTGAFPVIDKDYRADGLTRNLTLSLRVTHLW